MWRCLPCNFMLLASWSSDRVLFTHSLIPILLLQWNKARDQGFVWTNSLLDSSLFTRRSGSRFHISLQQMARMCSHGWARKHRQPTAQSTFAKLKGNKARFCIKNHSEASRSERGSTETVFGESFERVGLDWVGDPCLNKQDLLYAKPLQPFHLLRL